MRIALRTSDTQILLTLATTLSHFFDAAELAEEDAALWCKVVEHAKCRLSKVPEELIKLPGFPGMDSMLLASIIELVPDHSTEVQELEVDHTRFGDNTRIGGGKGGPYPFHLRLNLWPGIMKMTACAEKSCSFATFGRRDFVLANMVVTLTSDIGGIDKEMYHLREWPITLELSCSTPWDVTSSKYFRDGGTCRAVLESTVTKLHRQVILVMSYFAGQQSTTLDNVSVEEAWRYFSAMVGPGNTGGPGGGILAEVLRLCLCRTFDMGGLDYWQSDPYMRMDFIDLQQIISDDTLATNLCENSVLRKIIRYGMYRGRDDELEELWKCLRLPYISLVRGLNLDLASFSWAMALTDFKRMLYTVMEFNKDPHNQAIAREIGTQARPRRDYPPPSPYRIQSVDTIMMLEHMQIAYKNELRAKIALQDELRQLTVTVNTIESVEERCLELFTPRQLEQLSEKKALLDATGFIELPMNYQHCAHNVLQDGAASGRASKRSSRATSADVDSEASMSPCKRAAACTTSQHHSSLP